MYFQYIEIECILSALKVFLLEQDPLSPVIGKTPSNDESAKWNKKCFNIVSKILLLKLLIQGKWMLYAQQSLQTYYLQD